MKSLILLFTEKLEIPKASAIVRIVCMGIVLLLALATIIIWFVFFPYNSEKSIQIETIPGQHTQVSEILNSDILIDQDHFLEISKNQKTFISFKESTISYYLKKEEISYRYDQQFFYDSRYDIDDRNIRDGILFVNLKRSTSVIATVFIIFPFLFICMLAVFFITIQKKKTDYYVWTKCD